MDMHKKREMRKNKKQEKNQEVFHKTNINWYPGHMAKTMSEIKKDIKLIDLVCIILDARIPFSSNNKDIMELVKSKTVIMVMNKSDLADLSRLEIAEQKYRSEGFYTVRTNSLTGEGIDKLLQTIRDLGSRVKNKDKVSQIYSKMSNVYRVMVVGIPNVGKSTIINRLSGKNSTKVGNKPGVTQQKQWIRPAKDIEIMDTAGLLWPKLDENLCGVKLAITGNIKDEVVDKELIALDFIDLIKENEAYITYFRERYKLDENYYENSAIDIIGMVGKNRGMLRKGGEIEIDRTVNMILDEYRMGKIGRISLE